MESPLQSSMFSITSTIRYQTPVLGYNFPHAILLFSELGISMPVTQNASCASVDTTMEKKRKKAVWYLWPEIKWYRYNVEAGGHLSQNDPIHDPVPASQGSMVSVRRRGSDLPSGTSREDGAWGRKRRPAPAHSPLYCRMSSV